MERLLAQLRQRAGAEAMVGHSGAVTYAGLAERTDGWPTELERLGVAGGGIVAVVGNACPAVVAPFTALAVRGGVVVPTAPADPPKEERNAG
ncbi:hypothetical protein [Micromonospora chersina]|uniref:hypothetical protein n=1 Tax=Micromonospora chersina TaxID=47854 RepID=UPI0037113430